MVWQWTYVLLTLESVQLILAVSKYVKGGSLEKHHFQCVIVNEDHMIKNEGSVRMKVIVPFLQNTKGVLML